LPDKLSFKKQKSSVFLRLLWADGGKCLEESLHKNGTAPYSGLGNSGG